MLIELRTENHRSLRTEQVLSMEAGRVGDPEDAIPRSVEGHAARLLPAAAIYGANGSGKSNLLSAVGFMQDAVVWSHRTWPPEGGVPRESFAWGGRGAEPSLFEVTILVEGVRHQYGFVVNDNRVLEEWLYAWPRGRKQTWFERDGNTFQFGEHLVGENKLLKSTTRDNALFLSVAAQNRHEQLLPVYRWFSAVRVFNARNARTPWAASPSERRGIRGLLDAERHLSLPLFESSILQISGLLQAADVGIVDIRVNDVDGNILVRHQSTAADAWLPLEQESQGTLTLIRLGPALLEVLKKGGLLVVDELEASLHPLLAMKIVRFFNEPRTNPLNAQILFATHDTHLLGTSTGEPPLRRDQIWLTEKDSEGATCLYPLTDYKPRMAENLERGYLQGRYGAIPFLGDLAQVKS